MAFWNWYSVNPTDAAKGGIYYNRRSKPNSSVDEEWITYGVIKGDAKLLFEEYHFSDNDPDGVREAYGCMYETVNTFTMDASAADPAHFFVYTLQADATVSEGLAPNLDTARMIFVFTEPRTLATEKLLFVAQAIESKAVDWEQMSAFLQKELLDGEDTPCLVVFPLGTYRGETKNILP